ncbi:Metallo-dependent phosphatase-like protein [Sordaria brevicollis]|uniref:Metallo-dependent phosphatase-like protein n=1 Tax=Sordaria brevicollis TaxID=83679 RepID=A0AAE0UCT8_SORBR|nr:Metallo-dependent phosphatase-like protein [Sordaria brevicollis]
MTTSTTSPPDPTATTSTASTSASTIPSQQSSTPKTQETVPTRLLLLSDTHIRAHARTPLPFPIPSLPADVVIHAGDITDSSTLSEFSLCLSYLRQLSAPLKLLIAGNHDYTLDLPIYSQLVEAQSNSTLGRLSRRKGLGEVGDAHKLLQEAEKDGIFYLEEGVHRFELANGARLTVYASPATPAFGSFGFQYTEEEGHVFDIPKEADVVISHGPPRGVLDVSRLTRRSCGSVELWEAIRKVRPVLNVFGHVHEGWGAAVVRWPFAGSSQGAGEQEGMGGGDGNLKGSGEGKTKRGKGKKEKGEGMPEMTVLEDRRGVEEGWKDSKEERQKKREKVETVVRDGYYHLKYPDPEEDGREQTLFVNAAVPCAPGLAPWLVDIELLRSDVKDNGARIVAEERNGDRNPILREGLDATMGELQLS